jgi:NhaD family Na+/H+ antiporter
MEILIVLVFVAGYAMIAFEHRIKINKAAIALLTGVFCWSIYILFGGESHLVSEQLNVHLSDIASIVFFLIGAMTIVELVDAHNGFDVITNLITATNKKKLLWIVSFITFFLSSVLDNLTTTIVMISLLRKIVGDRNDRMLFTSMVIIAANAGGAWTPIGDVTTTMLWIGGQVTAKNIMIKLFLPSIVCILLPLIAVSFMLKGNVQKPTGIVNKNNSATSAFESNLFLIAGVSLLIFVPVFKTITHLPPYMGMLFGLGVLWVLSEIVHKDKDEKDKNIYSVLYALRKIDMSSVLFFLGILVAISALQSVGLLTQLATLMDDKIGNINIIAISIGLLSAVIDNVPLVAATMGMYDLQTYPADHYFWEFIAFTAGTGGSALIIGSAAGVVAMGMEKINFFWYLKKISWLALLGFFGGAVVYILQSSI